MVADQSLYDWLTLRRVHDGGIGRSAGDYLDNGLPTPGHLAGVFDRLIRTGLVTLADGDYLWGLRRMSLTEAGQARYAALSEQRRENPQAPPPEHGTQSGAPEQEARRRG